MKTLKPSPLKHPPLLIRFFEHLMNLRRRATFSSSEYWNDRYINGGTSGAGSYEHLAEFKARILNKFVSENEVKTVIEFGFGDGNQLLLSKYESYTGYDVSEKAVEVCRRRFSNDQTKEFYLVSEWKNETADLVLSLDVIYHLVENEVYNKYMSDVFTASSKYVVIYASNTEENNKNQSIHVRHRKFTKWIADNAPNWELINKISNEYPIDKYGDRGSFSDFYFYRKRNFQSI